MKLIVTFIRVIRQNPFVIKKPQISYYIFYISENYSNLVNLDLSLKPAEGVLAIPLDIKHDFCVFKTIKRNITNN